MIIEFFLFEFRYQISAETDNFDFLTKFAQNERIASGLKQKK